MIFKNCLLDNRKLIENYGFLKKYYNENDDYVFYSMNKLPFVINIVKGFKEGFMESRKCSEKELYQYVQKNFTETLDL